MTGGANAEVEGASAEPAVEHTLMVELAAVSAFLFSQQQIEHKSRLPRTNADDPIFP